MEVPRLNFAETHRRTTQQRRRPQPGMEERTIIVPRGGAGAGNSRRVRFAPPVRRNSPPPPRGPDRPRRAFEGLIRPRRSRPHEGRVVRRGRHMMRRGDYIDEYGSTRVTTRGLERHASETAWFDRRDRKRNVTRAVLEEQRRGREDGTSYRANVRMASLQVSWRSRDIARSAAEWDEYVVKYNGRRRYPSVSGRGDRVTEEEPEGVARVVSYEEEEAAEEEEEEEEEPSRESSPPELRLAAPLRGPVGNNNKRSVEEVYFEEGVYCDENSPPPLHSSGHYAYFDSQHQGYEVSYDHHHHGRYGAGSCHRAYQQLQQKYSAHGGHWHHRMGDKYEPLAEIQAKRSVACR